MIQMLCHLLEVLLTPENTPPDCPKDLYELYFVFACIWAFGGAMFQDQVWFWFQLLMAVGKLIKPSNCRRYNQKEVSTWQLWKCKKIFFQTSFDDRRSL